ncbi:MAG: polymer-forming cytoskeletal protein [Lachnospiraceae bacterium]|nr:polymer-forming cytoskeletal protein [Lachnospiraceae bacterium]
MCPADDLFDIIEPDDKGSTENKDFVQDESFLQGLDFIDGLPEDEDGEEEGDNEILIDDDISESPSDETQAEDIITDDINTDEAEIQEDNVNPEIAIRSDIPETTEDSFAFASNFVANAMESDGTSYDEDINGDQGEDDMTDSDDESGEDIEDDPDDQEDMMIVTEGTMITGSIATDRSLLVLGTINGDINCESKLTISGTVTGNSFATDVFINDQRTEGNITCTGIVKIGQGSVIIGDITAGAAAIAGAVKGNLDVKGPVILDSTAVIKGNIKAKSVQLINGAVLEGFCSLEEYSNSNMDEIFKP